MNYWQAFLLIAPTTLTLAACGDRQTHYGGPIEPIYSNPLPSTRQVIEIHYGGPVVIGGGRARSYAHRRRHGHWISLPAPSDVHYPHVLTDPVPLPKHKDGQTGANASPLPELDVRATSGRWTVAGAKVGCKIDLTSTKVVDVQKATSAGCDGSPLAAVTTWRKFGTNGIEMMQDGGRSVARFVQSSQNSFESIRTLDHTSLELKR